MRANLAFGAVMPALLFQAGCDLGDFSGARYNQDFHYSFPLKAGGRLSIESFNGAVELSGWDQDTVEINGTKYGPSREAAEALRIETMNGPDAVSIRVTPPSEPRGNRGARFTVRFPRRAVVDRIVTSNGRIEVRQGGGPAHLRTSNSGVRVAEFAGSLDVRTSNGPIDLDDVEGEVVARTSNSAIRALRLAGTLEAATSNGRVSAELAPGRGDRRLRIETSNSGVDLKLPAEFGSGIRVSTSNGPITLHMPGPVNAQIAARTSHSPITSDFDIKAQGEFNQNRMDGLIGAGGPLFELTTSNSPIRLLRM